MPIRLLLAAALLATASVAADTAPASLSSPAARFEWFEYTGRDARFAPPLPPGHFRNPILAGFYPDPSICRVGDTFYLINSTFAYYPGIPIFRSRDLVNWEQIGHVIHRPEQLSYAQLGVSRGIFAPAISHHAGVFYVVCTMVDSGGNFVVTATDPAGPWSDPVWLGFEGIDPSLFFDADGRAWIVNNGAPEGSPLYEGHRAIWIQEYDIAARKMTGPRRVLVNGGVDLRQQPIWIEGPHLYHRNGWYYLTCAEGGTGEDHSQVVFRSKTLDGPFEPWDRNPILTQRNLPVGRPDPITCTGHADLVEFTDGTWWAVFLGCRPYDRAGTLFATGRETFLLPVEWTRSGWPRILRSKEPVPAIVKAPVSAANVATGKPALPLTDNFTWRDEFDGDAIGSAWISLRGPAANWARLAGGRIEMEARPDTLTGKGQPAFLARRLQHATFEASTALSVPAGPGVAAGLVLFQGENYHYFFALRRRNDGLRVEVERQEGVKRELLASVVMDPAGVVTLTVRGDGPKLDFFVERSDGAEVPVLAGADAATLTTRFAGGFVGATVGLHVLKEQPK